MKIAIINYSSSGLFHYATCLANSLAHEKNHQVLFLTSNHNDLGLLELKSNLTVFAQPAPHNLRHFFLWLFNFKQQLAFYHAIKQFNPDVVHLTDSHALVVPHALWLKRYPVVFTQHDPVSHPGDVFRLSSKLIHATEQWLARKIVVHGQFLKDILVKRNISSAKINIIPHGDYSFFKRWQNPNTKTIPNSILFFGRIVDYKGLDVLLKAILILQKQNFYPTLILSGNGDLAPYQHLLKQIKHKQVDNHLIPDANIIHSFQQATLVALPYREASQSGIVAIALPAKVPVVATRVGALPEVLVNQQNSLLVPPSDPQTLALALRQVLTNQTLRQKLVAGGLQTVKNKISWSITSQQYTQVYKSIL